MNKNAAFMQNVKGTRNRTDVEKNLWNFRDSLTFSHSCQSFNNFYTVILAPMVYLGTFVIWNNIFVFTAVVSISVKAIMACYRRYFVGTRN